MMFFTGRDFVITVRHGGHGSLRALRHRLEEDPELLAKGPSAVLHAIADQVVDGYLAVADAVQDDIDEVEIDVFSAPAKRHPRGGDAGRIYQLKREVLEFKRAVSPLLRPMQLLSERPMRLVDPDIQKYFRDVADHLARVNEQVLGFDDLLNSILQANLAQATVAQNEDMRKITAWAAIFAVPTMIAGVYGMNFDHMPELHWKYGYPMVLGVIVGICFAHPPRLQAQRLAVACGYERDAAADRQPAGPCADRGDGQEVRTRLGARSPGPARACGTYGTTERCAGRGRPARTAAHRLA